MPLTLADVFLGLGSGFGGTGFCGNNLNHTNTETDTISIKKKDIGSGCSSGHLELALSVPGAIFILSLQVMDR